jgi:DNA-binding CsgD family transcriptional regulator
LKTSATYNEALPRAGAQNSLNVRLDGPDRTHIVWMLTDPADSSGWGSCGIKLIEGLLPHIRQFVRVRQALVNAEALGASSTALLENTQVGVIQLNRGGKIVAANDRALDILNRGEGLVDRGGLLSAQTPTDNVRLKRLLALALAAGGGQAAGGSMTVGRSSHLPRLALHVNPVTVQQMDLSSQRVAALVLVVDPLSQPRIDPDLVAETLGLTLAESRVATALAEGSNVRDIAVATRRKESTVRWFVKQIYEKQGISRQADLVRLGMSLADLSGSAASNSSAGVQRKYSR